MKNYSQQDSDMSSSETESKSIENANELELIGKDKEGNFLVKHRQTRNICTIMDTFAEMFPLWVGRVLVTADDERWALIAAVAATGFATSVIMSPAEAGIEGKVSSDETPDNRVGVLIQIYSRDRFELKKQMILRIGQCVMTCPTSSAFDAMPDAKRRVKVGRSIRLFGDGFQRRVLVGNRRVWRIPVMEGEFLVENTFGVAKAVAGGNFLIMGEDKSSGLRAAEEAVKAIKSRVSEVILPFPGGICRSGSKAGSLKYKLKASTNHLFCPRLRKLVPDSVLMENVNCVYEIVINGLTIEAVKRAMSEGIKAAVRIPGVVRISAGNYGGKLGPYKAFLKEVLGIV